MNHKEIQKAVWDESMRLINSNEDCNEGELLQKLHSVFTKYQNEHYWKDSFTAVNVPNDEVEWLKAGIEWYHGSKPVVAGNTISSIGYVCD